MAEEKRYYWLKLNENFFEDDTIQWIQEQPNGNDYIIFYIKLLLKSLKDNGKLIRVVGNRLMPYNVDALAKLTSTPVDTVRVAMELFKSIGLISIMDSGELYLEQINEMIGSETDSAKRVRKHRAKMIDSPRPLPLEALHCNTNETKCNTDIEIDKEIEIDRELDNKSCPDKTIDGELFERLWELYPRKEGKSSVTKKAKREITKIGFLPMWRAIMRYKWDARDKPRQFTLLGSTFFNSRRADFMDDTYKGDWPEEEPSYSNGGKTKAENDAELRAIPHWDAAEQKKNAARVADLLLRDTDIMFRDE